MRADSVLPNCVLTGLRAGLAVLSVFGGAACSSVDGAETVAGGEALADGGGAEVSGRHSGSDGSSANDGETSAGRSNSDNGEGAPDGQSNITGAPPCPNSPCKVMPLGDSITYGIGSSAGGGYRPPLFHLVRAAGKSVTFVGSDQNGPDMVDGVPFPKHHEGHSGYNTTQLRPLVESFVRSAKPDVVLLMMGTNDLRPGPASEIAIRLGGIVDTILGAAQAATVFVASITSTQDDQLDALVEGYNATIPSVVALRANAGKRVYFVDIHRGFVANTNHRSEYMYDNLHPNDAGYVVMADTWFENIGSIFER